MVTSYPIAMETHPSRHMTMNPYCYGHFVVCKYRVFRLESVPQLYAMKTTTKNMYVRSIELNLNDKIHIIIV